MTETEQKVETLSDVTLEESGKLARAYGGAVWLSLAGPTARVPGSVNVTAGRYGVVRADRRGVPRSGLDCNAAVMQVRGENGAN